MRSCCSAAHKTETRLHYSCVTHALYHSFKPTHNITLCPTCRVSWAHQFMMLHSPVFLLVYISSINLQSTTEVLLTFFLPTQRHLWSVNSSTSMTSPSCQQHTALRFVAGLDGVGRWACVTRLRCCNHDQYKLVFALDYIQQGKVYNSCMYSTGGEQLKTKTKTRVPGAGMYTAQILCKFGSDVNSLSVKSTFVTVWWFRHSTSSTGDKKNPYWLRSSSQ